ncbi:YbaB/EbfC family nucleoid-associated protein [Elusimicrobiota bacterium]
MDMFKMMKEAAAMKSKLSSMDKELKNNIIEVDSNGIKIKINAKGEILDIKLSPETLNQEKEKAEKAILTAIQTAAKKSQSVMAQEAKKITGGMNLPPGLV